jgi:hypothetical protein
MNQPAQFQQLNQVSEADGLRSRAKKIAELGEQGNACCKGNYAPITPNDAKPLISLNVVVA